MLSCNIAINKAGDASISIKQQVSESEQTLKVYNKMKIDALMIFNQLIRTLDTAEYNEAVTGIDKNKDVQTQWTIGKTIVSYINRWNAAGIDIVNIYHAIAKKLGGSKDAWELTVKFYTVNPNGEYLDYDWRICTILADVFHPDVRNILVEAHKRGLITTHENAKLWKRIIVDAETERKLGPTQQKVFNALQEKPQTEKQIAERNGIPRSSVRGRITELRQQHLYTIEQEDGVYRLVDDEEERKQKIAEATQHIKEIISDLDLEEKITLE